MFELLSLIFFIYNCIDPSPGVDQSQSQSQSQTYGETHQGAPRKKVNRLTTLGVARLRRR